MITHIFSHGNLIIQGEVSAYSYAARKGQVHSVYLASKVCGTTTFHDFKTVKHLYHYCRKHNFDILDERTNVERYIQDGELL